MLISIFILLLISVVAIALIVSSGTETSLAGNYRSSTGVYYAALAGVEEARGRMSIKDPNSFKTTWASFWPAPGTALPIGKIGYVLNPGPTETAANLLTTYPDAEYDTEFGANALANATAAGNVKTTPSVWNSNPLATNLSFPAPQYKWVRINAVSEQSLKLTDSYPFADGTQDPAPLYYDGTHLTDTIPPSGNQVLEITALAVLPNNNGQNTQKLLQYLVTPSALDLSFPAALTLDGPVGTFASSFNSNFWMNGLDQTHGVTCPPALPESPKPAIGVTGGNPDITLVRNGIPPYQTTPTPLYHYNQYVSSSPQPTNPSIGDISALLIPALATVNSLDGPQGVVQTISAVADAQHVTGPASGLPDYGSAGPPARPVTTVVQGDLTLPAWADGYGLLVVTGVLTMDGHTSWHGVILVIGQGSLKISTLGHGDIYGAVLIARTRHNDKTLRSSLGNVTFDTEDPNNSNDGFFYNSCWVNAVMPPASYQVLSFHEISQ